MILPRFEIVFKKQKYLVNISSDIAYKGGVRGLGTVVNVWRISNDPSLNNENRVIPGTKGFQGRYSISILKKFLTKLDWSVS